MKFIINTTIKPVGFDYAVALNTLGCLSRLHSAFPAVKSSDEAKLLNGRISYHDGLQIVYLILKRFVGESWLFRYVGHLSKIYLDLCTARKLRDADICLLHSGAGLITIRACKKRNILSVCQVHHAHIDEQTRILKEEAIRMGTQFSPLSCASQVRRQVREYDEVDVILCPSSQVKRSFERAGFPARKLIVVPHGLTLADVPPETTVREKERQKFTILFVGQMHYRKGLAYLYEALDILDDASVELRLVGPDFGAYELPSHSSKSTIHKVGVKKGGELAREYASADIFVLPSVEEGFGLVVLEAMAMSLPVIVTDAVGATDYVKDGVHGFVVPVRDPQALAQKILWLKSNPERRREIGANARIAARNIKGWEASARMLVESLETLEKT